MLIKNEVEPQTHSQRDDSAELDLFVTCLRGLTDGQPKTKKKTFFGSHAEFKLAP